MSIMKTPEDDRQSTGLASALPPADIFPLQAVSRDIWADKYCLKRQEGQPVDADMDATLDRVATAIAAMEEPPQQAEWRQKFLWALHHGAIPAGRILANAGVNTGDTALRPAASTINCTLSGTIHDSMDGIMKAAREAALTLQAGCGIGYDFSTLRPKGAFVAGVGAMSSGPLSFMDIFDQICQTVSAAGGRRGAQMAVLDIRHPDIETFIRAKRTPGRLRQFNLSVLITDQFLQAVRDEADWALIFPVTRAEQQLGSIDDKEMVWQYWPGRDDNRIEDEAGRSACRVYRHMPARDLWQLIMQSTWDVAEPGFILIDRVNAENPCWFDEDIRATNPCGEQPLPPHGACLLGSIDLTRLVRHPFTEKACFDWPVFDRLVAVFTRMLDNVVDMNGLPLPEQRAEILRKRRHGMGFLGLGSALAMLNMRYGAPDSLEFAARASQHLALAGWQTGLQLAKEKGMAPILAEEFTVTDAMLHQRPDMAKDGIKPGDKVTGRDLMIRYSGYFQRLSAHLSAKDKAEILRHGLRFTHHTSIAPTGTIALSMGNNASNGIEPSFLHHYRRNVIVPGKKSKQQVDVWSKETLVWRYLHGEDCPIPDHAVTAKDISPQDHLAMQAAVQPWIDSGISKTVNIPTDSDFRDFEALYMRAAELGLKGCTTYRYNPKGPGAVLVDANEQAARHYVFVLEDGREITASGDEMIDYDGELHRAANLYEALQQGYYGTF